jgi:hypothetical protein
MHFTAGRGLKSDCSNIKVLMQADSSLWSDFVIDRELRSAWTGPSPVTTRTTPAITQVLTRLMEKMRQ